MSKLINLNKHTGVLQGKIGSGKTSILSKLINGIDAKLVSGDTKGSLTRDIKARPIGVGLFSNMQIIDMPGLESSTDIQEHAVLQKAALTTEPINTIFMIVEQESRLDSIIQQQDKNLDALQGKGYAEMVVVVVNKMDKYLENGETPSREQLKHKQTEIKNELNENGLVKPKTVFFYSHKWPIEDLAFQMMFQMKKMKRTQLQYSETDFFENFPTVQLDRDLKKFEKKLDQELKIKELKWTEIFDNFEKEQKNQDNVTKGDICHCLLLQMNRELDNERTGFIEKHGADMNELNNYVYYAKITEKIKKVSDNLTSKIATQVEASKKVEDNFIRKCPHCKEIWVKVEGCDGQTTCGNRGFSIKEDKSNDKDYYPGKQAVVWDGIKYVIQKMNAQPPLTQTVKKIKHEATENIKAAGCGREIIWNQMPKLDNTELSELQKDFPGLRDVINSAKDELKEMRKKYDDKIDTTIHYD